MAGWSGFLSHLQQRQQRSLHGVELIISDAQARWQRGMVHFNRNVFSHVPASKQREVALMLKAINAQEGVQAAQRKAAEKAARLRSMRFEGGVAVGKRRRRGCADGSLIA